MDIHDVIVIGAGAVGSLISRALSRYQLDILLVDKASDACEGTTKANTAIVHAGYDAKPGTLKAQLNAAGNDLYDQVCGELDVEFDRCGTYVVGVSESDLRTLGDLYERGRQNGVRGLSLLSGDAMREREPSVTPAVTGALFAGTGGLVDPFQLCIGAAESAVLNGARVALNTRVEGFARFGGVTEVQTSRGALYARWVVIAAGLWADDLMACAGLDGFSIMPRKGEYFLLDKMAGDDVHTVLFPCPTPVSKGILVSRTIHGNVILGPNANDVDDKNDLETTSEGLNDVMSGAKKLVPTLDARMVIRTFAGLRATGSTGDFLIDISKSWPQMVVLAGIESPGLTASPAIAEHVVAMMREAGLRTVERPDWNPIRRGIPRFAQLSTVQREALIAKDSRFGRVICRCETVTEGEVVAALHAPIPARTYDGIKRRTRLGSGRCQGAFDTPRVLEIMAREMGAKETELTKRGGASRFVLRPTKVMAT